MDTNLLLQRALEVLRSIPDWSDIYFNTDDALVSVGMDVNTSESEEIKRRLNRLEKGAFQRYGSLSHANEYDANCDRAVYLAQRIKFQPNSKPASLAFVMQVAGFAKEQCGPGKSYMKVSRKLKATPPLTDQRARPLETDNANNQRPVPAIDVRMGGDQPEPIIHLFRPELHIFGDENTIGSKGTKNISLRDVRKNRQALIKSDISHLTSTKDPRCTTHAAQVERQTQRELDNIRKSMYKASTILYKSVQMNENTLSIFKSADAVARAMNNLVGIDCVSGRELAAAVRNNNVGKSPPRLGRKGEIPEDIFRAFCSLVFTACAIEQSNCRDRSTREELKSAVGEILNAKRAADGLELMSDSKFYARIESAICHLQDLNKADNRESLRVLWLTYQSQLLHYKNWEKEAIRLGFARPLNEGESIDEAGHIVWKNERLSHVLQFDEMNIALDANDSAIGGRASRVPTATRLGLNDAGSATEKSAAKMTVMFGINFAGEALPPLLVFPTQAKNPSNYKLKVEFAKCLPQLKARYGFDEPRTHNVPFAMNPKGDIASIIFGGTVTLVDGSTIQLPDAFSVGLDKEHILEAMQKCGYCPSTRAALKATQIRHEIMESEEGDIDNVADPYGSLLNELEEQNIAAVRELEAAGYTLANSLQRTCKRVTAAQTAGRNSTITIPNSRERQDAIMKISTAGGWFQVTNGGAPMTCDDALIAYARKDMIKEAEELEKKKQQCSTGDDVAMEAAKILEAGKDYKDWLKGELQVMIQWKQGPNPLTPFDDKVKQNKPLLVKLWEEKYAAIEASTEDVWTNDDEAKLAQLQAGEINCFSKDVGLERCIETEDDYLVKRLLTIGPKRRQKVVVGVLNAIEQEEADDIVSNI
ncbi:hypothetical protein SEMRO_756_G197690.1 [Seminavis robusta]|uniref:Uncharacterized protein n=1 Tax=Seminavis robusta TaxID=568900 RepID=A0A9N8HKS3_9STRA|nr:hypothetical protein SEMRO_756_G197690.1 [Seminavis robusta]|eukprot:Sro756_g197690.1 n/a (874) ;mRNA; r:1750-4796